MTAESPLSPLCDPYPVVGQPYSIELDSLGSDQIDAILPYFQGKPFAINPVTEVSGDCSDSITITGKGASLPFLEMDITAVFTVRDNEAALQITSDSLEGWTFANAFIPLTNSLLTTLNVVPGSHLNLSSFEEGNTQIGMVMDGQMSFSGSMSFLIFLMGTGIQPLQGPIDMQEGQPVMCLSGPTAAETSISFLNPFEDLLMKVNTFAAKAAEEGKYNTQSNFTISAKLPFSYNLNDTLNNFDIPITATIFSSDGTVVFAAEIEELILAGMEAISALANGLKLASLVPNQFFSLTQYVKFYDLVIVLDSNTDNFIDKVLIGVQNAEPWVFLSDTQGNSLLALEAVSLIFTWVASNKIFMDFGGTVQIGHGFVAMDAFLPVYDFGMYLEKESQISFEDVANIFVDTDGVDIPDFALTKYDMSGNPTSGAFTLDLNLTGKWNILPSALDFTLEFLSYFMSRPDSDTETTVSMKSQFSFAVYTFTITAEYPGSEEGWTFTGISQNGQQIPIGDFADNLVKSFGSFTLPDPVAGLTLSNIFTKFNTVSQNFTFNGAAQFPVDTSDSDDPASVEMAFLFNNTQLSTSDTDYVTTFGGSINISRHRFDLVFSTSPTDTWFIAAFSNEERQDVTAKEMVSALTNDETLLSLVPDGMTFGLKNALFAYDSKEPNPKYILAMDMENGINLSNLPFVGQFFPADQTITLAFQAILVGGGDFSPEELSTLNELLAPTSISLPDEEELKVGFKLITTMRLGDSQVNLELPVEIDENPPPDPPPDYNGLVSTDAVVSDPVNWWDLQKSFGPVTINRVGMSYANEELGFFMDASLNFGGLTLSTTGLGVTSPLTAIDPTFHIDGIGVDYKNGELEIGGAMIHREVNGVDQYLGTAVISMTDFKLAASGAYAEFEGQPSLFIYAVLDVPLGGPPAFFVTGLSGGFGYNRRLISPTIEQVKDFPFVSEAINGSDNAGDPLAELMVLADWVPPEVGQNFFAVGIKFTSFKLVDSFALLTVSFGNRLEFQLMGVASMVAPPMPGGMDSNSKVEPLAKVEMVLLATFLPEEGFIGVQAQLTDESYILSKDCKLTGGFAFFLWGKGEFAGDFVVTLGGYHPLFKKPSHYPKVPRLGFNWKVDSTITIKGGSYYALTPGYLMAGGSLEASWKSGEFAATFNAGADFLIGFKPYHYQASIFVKIGASYTFKAFGHKKTVSTNVGAKLDLWGPDFGGKAKIKWSVVSFTVAFGSKSGQSSDPILWPEFEQSFLSDGVLSLNARLGLQRTMTDESWIIDGKNFQVQFDSLVPVTEVRKRTQDENPLESFPEANTQVGIGPMGIELGEVISKVQLNIVRHEPGMDDQQLGDQFRLIGALKDVPGGLWGEDVIPTLDTKSFVRDALGGFAIVPMNGPDEGDSFSVEKDNLLFGNEVNQHTFSFAATETFEWNEEETVDSTIVSESVTNARNGLLAAMGMDTFIDLSDTTGDQFLSSPLVTKL